MKKPVPDSPVPPIPESSTGDSAKDRHVALVFRGRTRKEIVSAICVRILNGDRVHEACSAEGIAWPTLWLWKAEDGELSTLYARAREGSGESFEDKGTQVVEALTDNTAEVARVKEGHYRWRAKMANPKLFADKVDLAVAGARVGLEELIGGSMDRKPAP